MIAEERLEVVEVTTGGSHHDATERAHDDPMEQAPFPGGRRIVCAVRAAERARFAGVPGVDGGVGGFLQRIACGTGVANRAPARASAGDVDMTKNDGSWAFHEVVRLHRHKAIRGDADRPERHVLVLAGGSGRRLERLTASYEGRPLPKQYCAFGTRHTLLQSTVARTAVLQPERTTVVVRHEHAHHAEAQLDRTSGADLSVQPGDRGTGIGLLFGLVDVATKRPSARVVVTPADHGFRRAGPLRRTLEAALSAVEHEPERPVLIGAEADGPSTDYGWIVPRDRHDGPRGVERFVEKPGGSEAEALYERGGLWSTMILVTQARTLLELFARACPAVVRAFLYQAWLPRGERADYLDALYHGLGTLDFSRDVLSQSDSLSVMTLPSEAGWSDLGTEARMNEWLSAPLELAS
jgi:mannose-1-phosphate guanylyltransferase